MNSGYFIFDGLDTRTLTGVSVFPVSLDDAPARDFQVIQMPGRSGAVILDNKKYNNVERSYYVLIQDNFEATYQNLRGFLLSRTNYCKLQDSWFPDEYYMAYVNQVIKPKLTDDRDTGKFVVTFSRKPQRYLTSGDTPIDVTNRIINSTSTSTSTQVVNATYFDASPLFVFSFVSSAESTILAGRWVDLGSARNYVAGTSTLRSIDYNVYKLDTGDENVPLSTYIPAGSSIAIDTESQSAYIVGTNTYLNEIFSIGTANTQAREFCKILRKDGGYDYKYYSPKYILNGAESINASLYPRWYTI